MQWKLSAEQLGLNNHPLVIDDVNPSALFVPSEHGLTNEKVRKLLLTTVSLEAHSPVGMVRPLCRALPSALSLSRNITAKQRQIPLDCLSMSFKQGQIFTQVAFYRENPIHFGVGEEEVGAHGVPTTVRPP